MGELEKWVKLKKPAKHRTIIFFDNLDEASDHQNQLDEGEFKEELVTMLANNELFFIFNNYDFDFDPTAMSIEIARFIIDNYDKKE